MDLLACLDKQKWRTLRALAAARGVSFDSDWPKAEAAGRLRDALGSDEAIREAWRNLAAEARAALRHLAQCGNSLEGAEMESRFGPLHRYRPWQPESPPRPWESPANPTDELVYSGLVYPLKVGRGRRAGTIFVLPEEVRTALAAELLDETGERQTVTPAAGSTDIAAAIFAFLSFLNRRQVRPRWERWMAPQALEDLAVHLPHPAAAALGSSERRSPYVCFVHYLAETSGLVGLSAGLLKPALAARSWLARPLAERLRLLWAAWCAETPQNAALWERYNLPGPEWENPPARLARLLSAVAACLDSAAGQTARLPALLDALGESDPALFRPDKPYRAWADLDEGARESYHEEARSALGQLVAGPLAWFGALEVGDPETGEPAVALTRLGAALLGRDEPWPVEPAPEPLRIAPAPDERGAIVITAPPGLPPPARFDLEALVPPDPEEPGVYRLTRERLLDALAQGRTLQGIVDGLERDGGPLPPVPLATLEEWADDYGAIAIRPVTLLQARDPALLRELSKARRIRDKLGQTVSSRAVCIDSSRLDALLRELRRRGIVPHVEEPPRPAPVSAPDLSAEELVACVAALRVYAALAGELTLSVRIPYELLRTWEAALSQGQRDAVTWAVEEARGALRRATTPVAGEDTVPFPTAPLLPVLEAAIADGASVEIEYHPAGGRPPVVRRVDPLRLEERPRSGVTYLVAFCHLRQDNRTFRLDRIARVTR